MVFQSKKNHLMKKISRRNFIKNTSKLSSGLVILGTNTHFLSSCSIKNTSEKKLKIFIPMPIQVVIDDVGWWSGKDGSKKQEPYRTGINRNHVPNDYLAIAELGRELGIRPQAAIILCEWDKKNILRQLPTSTWMSEKWDNSKWVGQWLEETAEIIRNNKNHFELTVHGIGHEYWEGGNFTRAEWTDSKGQMRPQDQVELHLDYFEKLMNQHNLGSFPNSFVPTAFRHSFGPSEGRNISLAEILEKRGIMSKIFFEPVHLSKFYSKNMNKKISLPVTEKISQQVLTLPMYPSLTKNEINFISDTINEFFETL